jgi:hypothetical protein
MSVVEYIEKVNDEVCRKLNSLTFTQFEELFKQCLNIDDNGEEVDVRADYTKTKNYCREVLQSNNNYKVAYAYVKGKDFGRLQSQQPSLQRIFNAFRGLLCNDITYDLDMNNAHPKILIKLCQKHNIPCDRLEDYINNREDWLEELSIDLKIDRKEAKSLILKSINKESKTVQHKNKKIKNKKFIEFDIQTSDIINRLFDIYKKDYEKYVKNDSYNPKGKMMNIILCKIENEYLQKAIKYLESNKIQIHTLMFDGCMIYKENVDKDKIIKDLNKLFKKEDMQWSFKEHNLELLEKFEEMDEDNGDSFEGGNEVEIGNHMLESILKDKIYKCQLDVVYITSFKILKDRSQVASELYNLISKQNYLLRKEVNNKVVRVELSKKNSSIKDLIEIIMNLAPRDDKFHQKIWDETLYKIYFNNGYYDFKQKKFYEGEYNRTYIKINRNFNLESNDTIRERLYKKVIDPIFTTKDKTDVERTKLMKHFLYRLSRIIAGHIEDKRWILFQGLRNCGKGVISDLLKRSYEGYIKTTNASNFILKKASSDAAKENSWIVDYEFVRLVITQEITIMEDEKIDGNKIKKFCSGGDYLEGRKNFKDEYEFKIQTSLMICCNDIPEIKPKDAEEFKDEYQLKSKFVEKGFDETKKLKTFEYYEKDDKLKNDFLQKEEVADEFIRVLIEAYDEEIEYPKEIKQEIDEINDDEDQVKLFRLFEFTNDNGDFIANEDIKRSVNMSGLGITLKKAKILLKTQGAEEGRDKTGTKRGMKKIKLFDE